MHNLIGPMEADDELVTKAVKGILANESKLRNVPYEVTEAKLYQICNMAY